ncbi:MAG: imidazole glycerol phosphate synthase subunit HisH [Myxococcales bacterium]|nr:imidazole glycerol phosphate synthase subunit HisH [Myxococcales bacterium]MDD9966803.1 imidazole glycerol phosphate synthase subunit HisH [Myxococcales bacterium]
MLTIVDYNAGNLRSVQRACAAVGLTSDFTSDPESVARADRIIFPGVGHAKTAMDTLVARGLDQALHAALGRGTPILGICVGAQLVLDGSDEGPTVGLGWVPGQTRRFTPREHHIKVPHMGWNTVHVERPHPLLEGVQNEHAFYFVHSYYLDPADDRHVFATSDYDGTFCCALGRDNLFATQFHPEKSGRLGLALLERFARWEGTSC